MNQTSLGFSIGCSDMLSRSMNAMDASIKSFGKTLGGLEGIAARSFAALEFAGGALVGLGTSILTSSWSLAKSGSVVEASIAEIGHRTNASADQMHALQAAVFDAHNALRGFNANESAQALAKLTKEGMGANDAMHALGPSLLFAGITSQGAEEGAQRFARTLKEFHFTANNAGLAVDKLATASKLFSVPAGELAAGLSKVATGAELVGADMDDALLSIGLARAVLPDTAAAAAAVNKAFLQLANPKTVSGLHSLGIEVKNANGQLRGLPDILADVVAKTNHMTDATRASTLQHLFGARAAGGMAAIIGKLSDGIDDGAGHLLKGGAALDFLFAKMSKAKGAAEAMREAMLDSFAGQQQVLTAASESLVAALGVPFAAAFKPLVKIAAGALAKIAEIVGGLNPAFTKLAAQAVLLAGVLSVVVGAGLMVAGGAFLPIIVAAGAAALAIAAFSVAAKHNVGGIADFFGGTFDKIKLAVTAVSQLFSEGGLSSGLLKELDKAENSGIKSFALNAFTWFSRIKNFGSNLLDGFEAGIEKAQPTIDAFVGALKSLASHFGFVTDAVDPLANGALFDAAGESGKSWGDKLARAATVVVNAITAAIDVANGLLDSWDAISSSASGVGGVFDQLSDAINGVAADLGLLDAGVAGSTSGWHEIGSVLAAIGSVVIAGLIATFDALAGQVRAAFAIVGGVINIVAGLLTGDFSRAWRGVREIVYGVVSSILSLVGAMVSGIGHAIDALGKLAGKDLGLGHTIDAFRKDLDVDLKESLDVYQKPVEAKKSAPAAPGASAFKRDFFHPDAHPQEDASASPRAQAQNDLATAARELRAAKEAPIHIANALFIDGQQVADVLARVSLDGASRNGGVVPPSR